jgi:hypothetical protein
MSQTLDFTQMKWEEKPPFGKRTVDGYLQIYPLRNTSEGRDPRDLDKFGLTGHPNQIWEHVEHMGYLEPPQDDKFSLLYRFRPRNLDRVIWEQYYARFGIFFSVQTDAEQTGYWHLLENISDRTIVVKIEKLNRDANLISK